MTSVSHGSCDSDIYYMARVFCGHCIKHAHKVLFAKDSDEENRDGIDSGV